MIQRRIARSFLLAFPLALLVAGQATGQLDLPAKPKANPKDPADELLPPSPAHGDVAPKSEPTPLDLPSATPPALEGALLPATAGPATAQPEEVARALFRELARARDLRLVEATVKRLLALGPGVLAVARAELDSEHGPTLLAAGRVCLGAGQSAERAAVAERLARALPAEVAGPLLEELLARDPMLASPDYLAALLDHPGSAMRNLAFKALAARLDSVPLQALASDLSSARTATRAAALELIARVADPLAWNLLASRLADPSAQVARRAAELLARIDAAESLLLERAFPDDDPRGPLEWGRARAYALLGVIEREEVSGIALLEGPNAAARIASLRAGLAGLQPLASGACAIALARLGFRASARLTGSWLEREVPHQLVRCGTGAEFHPDFSALERPALRALGLLSGEAFGADGEAWRRWWLAHASGFHARHARIELAPGAAEELQVSFQDQDGRVWRLCAARCSPGPSATPVLRLTRGTAERLCARFENEGAFGVEHLPTARGSGPWALWIAVGEQEKGFTRSGGGDRLWLDRLQRELEQVVEENRWQLYLDLVPPNAREPWEHLQASWAALTPLTRRRTLTVLLISGLRGASVPRRDELTAELVRLYADAGVPEAADFEPLLAALAAESAFGPRAASLCELARIAAGAAGNETPESAPRERLVALLLEHFGPEADPAVTRVARDLEPEALRRLAQAVLPRARALAATGLLRAGERVPDGLELLRALLVDPEPLVQLAVLLALAAKPHAPAVEGLRAELLAQARSSSTDLRLAGLRVLSLLGGEGVHDLALEAVGDGEPDVQKVGVEALAELADPRSASLLASLLARGPASPHYAAARRGLKRMGAAGRAECSRLARTAGARAGREAALLLSEALAPEAAGLLLTLLHEDPGDERVLAELAVLAGLDFSLEQRPDQAAWSWWEQVVHDEPLAWLLSAAERVGVPAPPRAALSAKESAEGARFLLAVADTSVPPLVERALRELEQRLGTELHRPGTPEERAHLRAELQEAVRARFGE